jgi:hypothetical protein
MVRVADESKALTANILSSAQERGRAIGELRLGVAGFLGQCRALRSALAARLQQMATEQRGQAAEREATRLDAFMEMQGRHDELRDRIVHDVAMLAADTCGFLGGCEARQRVMQEDVRHAAEELRRQLADGDCARREAFSELHGRVAGRVAELSRNVRKQLAASRHGVFGARAAWQHLACVRSGAHKTSRRR